MHNRIAKDNSAVHSMQIAGSREWAAFGRFIVEMPELMGFYQGVDYTGHTLKQKGDRWLLIVRVRRGGKKMVCFLEGDTIVQVWRLLWGYMHHNQVNWKSDKY